ncbi:NUDIX domain-containing protein [Nakamurella sp. A5-74]|uniref:NUDIX domain-containing protein n=1 Tax=Nakamurella sp. A5-74 TaxID=3158264 RepID=A0AAU8DQG3_9ACTN
MAGHRDSAGRRVEDYPRPSVAVDTALLTIVDGVLSVLQVRRPHVRGWALPGAFLHPGERLIDAVRRSLQTKAGIAGCSPRQLHVFDNPDRDDRGWVLSVAHVDTCPESALETRFPNDTRLVPVSSPGRLPYGHDQIIDYAVADLRNRYRASPDPDGLLPEPFTLLQLRELHEAVAGEPLQRDGFRRAMQPLLEPTGELTQGLRGRPAALLRVIRADPSQRV